MLVVTLLRGSLLGGTLLGGALLGGALLVQTLNMLVVTLLRGSLLGGTLLGDALLRGTLLVRTLDILVVPLLVGTLFVDTLLGGALLVRALLGGALLVRALLVRALLVGALNIRLVDALVVLGIPFLGSALVPDALARVHVATATAPEARGCLVARPDDGELGFLGLVGLLHECLFLTAEATAATAPETGAGLVLALGGRCDVGLGLGQRGGRSRLLGDLEIVSHHVVFWGHVGGGERDDSDGDDGDSTHDWRMRLSVCVL